MDITQAIEKLNRIKSKYGNLKFYQQTSNGMEEFNFYLRSNENSNSICVCTTINGPFDPEIGDEHEEYDEYELVESKQLTYEVKGE